MARQHQGGNQQNSAAYNQPPGQEEDRKTVFHINEVGNCAGAGAGSGASAGAGASADAGTGAGPGADGKGGSYGRLGAHKGVVLSVVTVRIGGGFGRIIHYNRL